MQGSFARVLKRASMAGLLCLLAACSALRLAYDQGPQLAWWWLDGYADFERDQAPRVKEAIAQWFAWHRTTQLGDYAAWLAALRARIGDSVTAADVCRWGDEVVALTAPALDQALVAAAPLVAQLTEAQFRRIEQRYAKGDDDFRKDFMQQRADERLEAIVKRNVERAEMLYGSVDDRQRALLRTIAAESPFDPETNFAERQRRHRETLKTLRRLAAERADAKQALPVLRALAERTSFKGGDAAYRAYSRRVQDYGCAAVARLHATTTPEQRVAARKRLEGWEDDLRRLQAAPPG